MAKPTWTIPEGCRVVTIGGCNYLLHESEMHPRRTEPCEFDRLLESLRRAEG